MKIILLIIGKTKEKYLELWIAEYLKIISRFASVEIVVLKESSKDETGKIIKEESESILDFLKKRNDFYSVLLDKDGLMETSESFAKKLEEVRDFKGGKLLFVTGGAYGVSDEVKAAVSEKLSFGKFTFTHQMIRVMLLEQIYRGFSILSRSEYHH